jgi:hypothetical protein
MPKPPNKRRISINPCWRLPIIFEGVRTFRAFVYRIVIKTTKELYNRWFSVLVALCTNPMRWLAHAGVWFQHISEGTRTDLFQFIFILLCIPCFKGAISFSRSPIV